MERRKTILCVDDEPAILHSIERLFHATNYRVVGAPDGNAAIAAFAGERPDLVILDVNMPGMNGYDVMERLRSGERREVPFVLLTGRADDEDILKGYGKGATYYLTKPFKNRRLMNIVDYLIGDLTEDQRQKLELEL